MRFWGSPWHPRFMDWAFNLATEAELQAKWALIADDIAVLITHGPPLRILDRCFDGREDGCAALARRVREIGPALHLFSHIHEGYGWTLDPAGESAAGDRPARPVSTPFAGIRRSRERIPVIYLERPTAV